MVGLILVNGYQSIKFAAKDWEIMALFFGSYTVALFLEIITLYGIYSTGYPFELTCKWLSTIFIITRRL